MKNYLMIVGAILAAVLLAAGSFWGGMAYQSKADETAASQAQNDFLNARGQPDGGGFPDESQGPAGNQAPGPFGGGGTNGIVKTIEGNLLTISTAQDVTTVNISEETLVEKYETGAVSDLQTGIRVMVNGQRESDDSITASRITILNSEAGDFPSFLEPPYPSAGTEP